jgi:hypothetical protein
MSELTEILVAKRKQESNDRKFLAALQGVELDGAEEDGEKIWQDKLTKAFSGGQTSDPNDVLSLQGMAAQREGFGIGNGLDYTNAKDLENPSW